MNSISGSELLAGKPANKPAAAKFAPRFQTPVDAQQIAPWNIDRFAIENFSEHDTVALKELLSDGFDRFAISSRHQFLWPARILHPARDALAGTPRRRRF